ncbi:MAG: ribosome biogenesis GTPase Der [Acidobacteriota bacterium]|nr:ribosome biogenesis GTPase Der [Acidobacteriota bacterium]
MSGPSELSGADAPAPSERRPVGAVAGRPNVGKSTLVNRLVGRRATVVEERPGVTRDRINLEAEWNGRPFVVVDTGGWLQRGDELDAKVSAQAERAMAEADLVLLVVDVAVGITVEDEEVARRVRRSGRPALVVVNKVDNDRREADAWEALSLGLGTPVMVSALHGRGTGDLLDEVVGRLPDDALPAASPGADAAPDAEDGAGVEECPRVAIVGRPNVGKSTLFNRLIGEERAVVHDLPGTTRDAVDTVLDTPDGPVRFVDTAGMRRASRTERGTEYFAVVRALAALDEADVALLVIDATEGVTHQDQRLAERIGASGSPAVVVLNKWELLDAPARAGVLADVGDRLAFLAQAPVVKISARTGRGVHRLLPALRSAVEAYHQRIPTGELNRAIRAIQAAHSAPGGRIRYAVQGASDPPTFTLFTSGRLPATYLRYVERKLREQFDIGPTPMKLRVRLPS